jgi:hypothetical protein
MLGALAGCSYQKNTMTVRDGLGELFAALERRNTVDEKSVVEKLGVENVALTANHQGIPRHDYIVVIAVAQSCTGFAR